MLDEYRPPIAAYVRSPYQGPLGHELPYTFDAHGHLHRSLDPKDRELRQDRNTRNNGKTEYGVDHRAGQALNRFIPTEVSGRIQAARDDLRPSTSSVRYVQCVR